jgi:predicted RNA-binding protein YlqC (UPF0109 family)
MTDPNNSLDEQILHQILINLVTVPEDVKIERKIDEQGVLLSIIVNSKDMGIVIGRNGSMATSIKTIMRAVGKANQMNIRIQFLEPDGTIRFSPRTNEEENLNSQTQNNYSNDQVSSASALDDDLKDFVVN